MVFKEASFPKMVNATAYFAVWPSGIHFTRSQQKVFVMLSWNILFMELYFFFFGCPHDFSRMKPQFVTEQLSAIIIIRELEGTNVFPFTIPIDLWEVASC